MYRNPAFALGPNDAVNRAEGIGAQHLGNGIGQFPSSFAYGDPPHRFQPPTSAFLSSVLDHDAEGPIDVFHETASGHGDARSFGQGLADPVGRFHHAKQIFRVRGEALPAHALGLQERIEAKALHGQILARDFGHGREHGGIVVECESAEGPA